MLSTRSATTSGCLVLTGAGKAFCTGANLQGRNDQSGKRPSAGTTLETAFHPFLRRLRNLHCPIVSSVNGPACRRGHELRADGRHHRLRAVVVFPASDFAVSAWCQDCGSTWILPRLIGKARSVELSLMGERLPSEKALEWGLVNRVVDDAALAEETRKLAHDLANGPTVALSLIRRLYWESENNSFEEQLDLEQQFQRVAGRSEDFKEGVGAFLEKRPAKFKGR